MHREERFHNRSFAKNDTTEFFLQVLEDESCSNGCTEFCRCSRIEDDLLDARSGCSREETINGIGSGSSHINRNR